MFSQIQVVAIIGSLSLLLLILELIRKGKLAEEYSFLWVVTGVVLFILSAWRGILHFFAKLVGIYYPPSALFLVGFVFVLLLILHFSVIVSRLSRQNRELAQTLALFRLEMESALREKDRERGGSDDG